MKPELKRKTGAVTLQNLQAGTQNNLFKVEVFKKSLSFAHLREDHLDKIAAHATIRYFPKKEFIFHEGDPASRLCIVQYGRVKLFKGSTSGKEFVAHIAGPGNTLNIAALCGQEPHFLTAQCIEDTSILCVGREEFLSFLSEYPSVATKIIAIMGEVTNIAYEKIIDLLVEKVDLRVSNVLFMLSSKFGTTLSLTCRDIADIAGTTTESTIRVLSKLKKQGILRSCRHQIIVLDQVKLHESSRSVVGEEIFNYF
ncbi:MAG: Crp/Fnr family transcriptional regulator [Syntrophorhabdales bacterium]|jgi:CRP-like cAMP-binding protein